MGQTQSHTVRDVHLQKIGSALKPAFNAVLSDFNNHLFNSEQQNTSEDEVLRKVSNILKLVQLFPSAYESTAKDVLPLLSSLLVSKQMDDGNSLLVKQIVTTIIDTLEFVETHIFHKKGHRDEGSYLQIIENIFNDITSVFIICIGTVELRSKTYWEQIIRVNCKIWTILERYGKNMRKLGDCLRSLVLTNVSYVSSRDDDRNDVTTLMIVRHYLELTRDHPTECSNSSVLDIWSNFINSTKRNLEMKTENNQFALQLLCILVEFVSPVEFRWLFFDETVIRWLQRGLRKNSVEKKLSSYLLKCITGRLMDMKKLQDPAIDGDFEVTTASLPWFGHLDTAQILKFWTDFIDLYEILDEKQSNIILPFLPKLDGIRNSCNTQGSWSNSISWYYILLGKMMHHDNRLIAKEGLERFVTSHIGVNGSFQVVQSVKSCILNTVLPVLKDNVGWILPEASDFFKVSDQLAEVVAFIVEMEQASLTTFVKSILQFFANASDVKGISAHCTLFVLHSVHLSITKIIKVRPNMVHITSECETVIEVVNLLSRIVAHSLTTFDKFLRLQVEKYSIQIVKILLTTVKTSQLGRETMSPTLSANFERAPFTFTGSLSLETIWIQQSDLKALFETLDDESSNSNPDVENSRMSIIVNNTKGFFRSLLVFSDGLHVHMLIEHLLTEFNLDTSVLYEFFSCLPRLKNFQNLDISYLTTRFQDLISLLSQSVIPGKDFHESMITLRLMEAFKTHEQWTNYLQTKKARTLFPFGENHLQNFLLLKLFCILGEAETYSMMSPELNFLSILSFTNFFHGEQNVVLNVITDSALQQYSNSALLSEYYQLKFQNMTSLLKKYGSSLSEDDIRLLELKRTFMDGVGQLDLVGPTGFHFVIDFFHELLKLMNSCDVYSDDDTKTTFKTVVPVLWQCVFESRKNDAFWSGYESFVKLLTNPKLLETNLFVEYSNEIFAHGDTITAMPLVFMDALKTALSKDFKNISNASLENVTSVLMEGCIFGTPMLKNHMVDYRLWEHINKRNASCGGDLESEESGDSYCIYNAASKSRLISVLMLSTLVNGCVESKTTYMGSIIKTLLEKNDLPDSRKRYFGNSMTHRSKQRVLQVILILQPLIPKDIAGFVMQKLLHSLTDDSPQPSVRFLSEWIIIKLLLKYSSLWNEFFTESLKCCGVRIGCGVSFSTMCFHTAPKISDSSQRRLFCKTALDYLAKLMLSSHFSVRIHAQIAFCKLFEIINLAKDKEIVSRYELLYASLESAQINNKGNFSKIHQNIQDEFYIKLFDPEKFYNFKVILIDLPAMTGVYSDELLMEHDLMRVLNSNSFSELHKVELPSFSSDFTIPKLVAQDDVKQLRPIGEEICDVGVGISSPVENANTNNDAINSNVTTLQKKINPWKSYLISDEISNYSTDIELKKRNRAEDGLVVVASLIDRVPNLGGLCRSCEIFGVSKYVVSSLRILEDQQFQNLSVSAHNWIDLLEVPVHELKAFLVTYSAKGYTILGIEQAIGSASLQEYKFPKKSVLLLGHEKYGIPTELLHLIDQCIEIPQVGVVRSLNVHVTGAICIWQYAAQHNFN